jgi:hypothetical protein
MANDKLTLNLVTNVNDICARIKAMSDYLDSSPDDDPLRAEMLAFGEIDTEKHLAFATHIDGGKIVCTVTPCAELARLMDMIPA